MTENSEVSGEKVEQKMAENGTNGVATNGNGKEESVLEQTASDETVVVAATRTKVLNVAPAEEVPENFDDYLSETQPGEEASGDTSEAVPTSVIQSVPKADDKEPEEEKEENLDKPEESAAEETPAPEEEEPKEASCTVADLIEEEEDDKEEEETEESKEEEAKESEPESQKEPEKVEEPEEKEEESKEEEMKEDDKKAEARSAPSDTKTAAELAYEWDDEGVEEEKPKSTPPKKETPKKKEKSAAVLRAEAEVTPGRKSSRTPKPTQRKLESENQKNIPLPEEDEDKDGDGEGEEDEESVDAIAKELEKSDSDPKKSPKGKGSPKKGKKPVSEEKSQEDWEKIIFGENGEKVTEKGKKAGDAKTKDKDGEEGPEAEEFLPDDTPKSKKGGRPKKKGLDEVQEGVAKLGSNMYFYTGPGGSESPPPLDSDEEDLPIKKADSEPARKSSRANKGTNKRLERKDEVVDIPQVKEAPKPNLNPSWLKNHDSKNSPVKKASTPAAKATPVAKTPASSKKAEPAAKKADKKEEVVEKEEEAKEEEPMETEEEAAVEEPKEPIAETPKGRAAKKVAEEKKEKVPATPSDAELPEFDPEKFTPGYVPPVVKKGEDEYMIVVSGVKDTGLCGSYWNVGEGGRRRSKPPETLQMGKNEKRRGSVGSVGSEKSGKSESPAPGKKAAVATPKSNKKQVTKPEKAEPEPEKTPGRGKKRKGEEAAKKEDDTKEFSDYDSAKEETTQPLRKKAKKSDAESPSKDPIVSSKQHTAVQAALAAGVPAGQQRSVSCVADTNTQKEVVVECFAPYDDHRWVNIGKERDGMAPDAVQYARALRPPYHLLSFLRIKGHSTKGMSCTDKNTMVFVVLEGEITVILHTTQFNAKKGDSFYIPPKNYYNLINQKAREAELSLIQFQYDGPLPTVQPSS